MYLKRLEIVGFKSFADKIRLDFLPGVTGVVGPNGSGKSNISDSLRWVLGEQSIKNLRGMKMDDVNFAGSQLRKPLGLAEVTIILDNSDHSIPIDFSEISVTRKLFRS
ncbi:MAG TPA: AAA family ATPase, partial [Bacillota bacterium]